MLIGNAIWFGMFLVAIFGLGFPILLIYDKIERWRNR